MYISPKQSCDINSVRLVALKRAVWYMAEMKTI